MAVFTIRFRSRRSNSLPDRERRAGILVALRVQTTGSARLWELLALRGSYEASSRRR